LFVSKFSLVFVSEPVSLQSAFTLSSTLSSTSAFSRLTAYYNTYSKCIVAREPTNIDRTAILVYVLSYDMHMHPTVN
jgi:hypothetical protein